LSLSQLLLVASVAFVVALVGAVFDNRKTSSAPKTRLDLFCKTPAVQVVVRLYSDAIANNNFIIAMEERII